MNIFSLQVRLVGKSAGAADSGLIGREDEEDDCGYWRAGYEGGGVCFCEGGC